VKCFRGNISGEITTSGELAIRHLNQDAGITIDATTCRTRWLGERMDVSLAIEGMQWRRDLLLPEPSSSDRGAFG
jgi:hypothetical protein